mgnify:FL=1
MLRRQRQRILLMLSRIRIPRGVARTIQTTLRGAGVNALSSSMALSRTVPLVHSTIIQHPPLCRWYATETPYAHSLQQKGLSSVSSFEDAISLIDV